MTLTPTDDPDVEALQARIAELEGLIQAALSDADERARAYSETSFAMIDATLARDPDRPDAATVARYDAYAAGARANAYRLRRVLTGAAAPEQTGPAYYDRVRTALTNQLRSQVPGLSDMQVKHKARMLTAAVRSVPLPTALPLDRDHLAVLLMKALKGMSDAEVLVHRTSPSRGKHWHLAQQDADALLAAITDAPAPAPDLAGTPARPVSDSPVAQDDLS